MPRGDRTGPMGMGPATGRGAGYCTGYAEDGYMSTRRGYGMGLGRGFRRMFCQPGKPFRTHSRYWAYNAPLVDEKDYLNQQAEVLENQLKQVKDRLKTLNEEKE